MATFAELKTRISRKLLDPSNTAVSSANVGDAINDSVRYWKYTDFWFNQSSSTTTLVVGDPLIPSLPSDFLMEDSENGFVIPYNQISYTLKKRHPKEFDSISIQNALGLPFTYTWRDDYYYVYFSPNIAYTLNIYYLKDYNDLVNDSDYNDFTVYADQLIMYEALARLAGEDRQDPEMAASYAAKAIREKENLEDRTMRHAATGRLSVDTII